MVFTIMFIFRMNARYILLNHLSQRYPQVPKFNDSQERTGIACDLMNIRLSDFWKLPLYMPVIRSLFRDIAKEEQQLQEIKEEVNK